MIENKKLKTILENLPRSPGVYKMLDEEGRVIYLGKAKDLAKRVKQYFQKNYEHSSRTKKLLEKVTSIETIGVDSELEAMILEHNLIKQLQPKYNVIMKDDKNYVYIKITKEDFPRVQIVRKVEKDNAKYFGPKTAAHKVKETFNVLKKIFPFRHCGLDIESLGGKEVKVTNKVIKYPCLDFYIKKCIAPCIAKCTIEEYAEIIKNVESFLEGKADEVLQNLYDKMGIYARNREFEKAAKLRDRIKKVEAIREKQKVQTDLETNQDIINYCIAHNRAFFNLFQIRNGKLIGQENFILSANDLEDNDQKEVLEAFLNQYYEIATDIPKEILIPHELELNSESEKLIEKYSGKKTKITIPKIGTKNKLLEMSLNNARIYADRNKPSWREESELTIKASETLQRLLKIKQPLKRIECYDISHLSGTETVGSMIVFIKGAPKNSMYRKFKLKTVDGKPDDYKSMEELLFRRFSKIAMTNLHAKYAHRRANKKDKDFIEKNNEIDFTKTDRQFFILEKEKKQIGFISVKRHSEKVIELNNLWIKKNERGKKLGYKLIKETIKKCKIKRAYVICREEMRDYYLIAGFEEIKNLPEELTERYKQCVSKHKKISCLSYDTNKHKEDESFKEIPDLIIIDGGKGQLSIGTKVFKELGLDIPYLALAKQMEEIFLPDKEKSIILERNNEALKLLQRARDEAHRFAISYNQNRRLKKMMI